MQRKTQPKGRKDIPQQSQLTSNPPEGVLSNYIDAFTYTLDLADSLRGHVEYTRAQERCFTTLRAQIDKLWRLNEMSIHERNQKKVLDGVIAIAEATGRAVQPFDSEYLPQPYFALGCSMLPDLDIPLAVTEIPIDEIVECLEWLLTKAREHLSVIALAERGPLNALIGQLEALLAELRAAPGGKVPIGKLFEIQERLRPLLNRVPRGDKYFRLLRERLYAIFRSLAPSAGGTLGTWLSWFGRLLARIFKPLMAFALGVLIGKLIRKIPWKNGKNVGEALDDWLSDAYYATYMKFSRRFSCDDHRRHYEFWARRRRYMQEDLGETAHIMPALLLEIHFLENYIKCSKPDSSVYANELARLKARKQRIDNNPF